jgi:CheY-like chemotaxis protein
MRPEIARGRRIHRNVLIIDDNEDLARSLSCLLEFHGCRVEVALDGVEGVRLALQNRFDVIFIDIGLPKMSGYEVAAAIRDGDADAPVLLAQTAYAQPEDVRRSFESGFDGHLVKPVLPQEILRYVVEGRAGLAKRRGASGGAIRPNGPSSARVAPAAR